MYTMKATTDLPRGITNSQTQSNNNSNFNFKNSAKSNFSNINNKTTLPGTTNTFYAGNNKHELNVFSNQYAITQNNDINTNPNFQSPKLRTGKSRPSTSIGFSINDVNPKFVNLDGIKTNPTYEKETMYTMYGEFLKKPKHTFTDYRDEEKKIKQNRAESSYGKYSNTNSNNVNNKNIHIDRFFPLDGQYFPTFHNEYTRLLTESRNDAKIVKQIKQEIKNKCSNSNVLSSDRLASAQPLSKTLSRLHSGVDDNNKSKQKNYYESDIFNLNERISTDKSSEKYTINRFKNQVKPYSVSSKSNSEWKASNAHPSLFGHSNTDYHILNPCIKNITKTKSSILENKTFNPIHRQKMLSEYIDITRVGYPNPNQDFRKTYNTNKFLFNRTSDLCTNFLDNHQKNYKSICPAPFKVKK